MPLLEDGGNVEDETLSDMFASLLAGHLDPSQQDKIHPSYSKVLAQLSPCDAKFLMLGSRNQREGWGLGLEFQASNLGSLAKEIGVSLQAAYLSGLNLERLGIVEFVGYQPPDGPMILVRTVFKRGPEQQQLYVITKYGMAFFDACLYVERP